MASEGYEAVDLKRKKFIEEELAEELDDAIIKVAKMRKRQPPKLRSKARNIASNTIHYYSRVCVKANASTESLNLNETLTDVHEICMTDTPQTLKEISKVITDCLAETKDLMKFRHHLEGLRRKGKCRIPLLTSPHLFSTDFVVDEDEYQDM